MNNLILLTAGNAVLWLAVFVLIYTMVGRQQRMEEKHQALEQHLQNDAGPQAR